MKIIKTLLGILTLTTGLVAQIQAQNTLTNGLVAYYPFNGNANDASGNGNNLINYGATLCVDRFGNSNQAYNFNGSSYLGSSTTPLSQVNNWTISAWIEPASLPQTTPYAVCVGYDNGTTGDGYALGIAGGETGFSPGNQVSAFFPGLGAFTSETMLPSTNQWYQVVMTRGSGEVIFYTDGVSATNSGASPYSPLTPTSFEIGSGGSDRFFNGAIGEVRIYNRSLSASEAQQLYQYESVQPCHLPYSATASATVTDGFVVAATVTDGGCGYTNTPLVVIVGGGGDGATAMAVVTNGMVVGIAITDAGIGYTSAPTVYIYSPLGVQIGILQAVIPTFSDLSIGSNYQLQASSDLNTWTNQGSAFTATNPAMIYPRYFNVAGWNQLYFRLQAAP